MTWALVATIFVSSAPSPAGTTAAARAAMDQLRYPEARALLAKARQKVGLSREELIELLWLQGLVDATLNHGDDARAAFRTLFAIAPDHQPEREYPPKIMSPYYEARGWIATNKPLDFQPLDAVEADGRIKRIGVKLGADPLSLVQKARIHVEGQETTEHALNELTATRDVDAQTVRWWAELIGERDAELARLGDAEHPLVAQVKPPEVKPEALATAPATAMRGDARLRSFAYVAAGLSAAAFAVGIIYGVRSNGMANTLRAVQRDADGVVVNITQSEAIALNQQQRREATLANAMFITGGVLLAAGVTFFLLGREVAVTVAPTGVAVAGALP